MNNTAKDLMNNLETEIQKLDDVKKLSEILEMADVTISEVVLRNVETNETISVEIGNEHTKTGIKQFVSGYLEMTINWCRSEIKRMTTGLQKLSEQ